MADVTDGYDLYYADKLWSLIPGVYRYLDPTSSDGQTGPLREIANRIGAQVAVVRRSIDRMWQDQSIETCDDWVIPYLAALLKVQLPAVGQRRALARAMHYRRQKGTLSALEETAFGVTGWTVKATELYRRLGRTRHALDPALGWPLAKRDASGPSLRVSSGLVGRRTGTAIGGFADLRNVYGASRSQTAFDELFHTADVRAGRGKTGWQNIPHLGLFLFRLQSVPVDQVTPVEDARRPGELTFDPTGREVPLFVGPPSAFGGGDPGDETQFPVPIDAPLLFGNLERLYAAVNPADHTVAPNSLRLYETNSGTPSLVAVAHVTADPRGAAAKYGIDPARGRVLLPAGADPDALLVGYHYGFSSMIGAGGYDRRVAGQPSSAPATPVHVSGGADALVKDATFAGGGTIQIDDSLTYREFPDVKIGGDANALVVRAANNRRPVFRARHGRRWTWRITGALGADQRGSVLVLDGLLISGATIELAGDFERVVISTTTLDPGGTGRFAWAVDGQSLVTTLRILGRVRDHAIKRSIVGAVHADGAKVLVERATISDTIAQVVRPHEPALSVGSGKVTIARATILGGTKVQQIEATDSLFVGNVRVSDLQDGCVRYSALPRGSVVPRPYECVVLPGPPEELERPIFGSTSFGRPHYGQLRRDVDPRIATGSEDGSEMGAFCMEQTAIKERALLANAEEQMPIGLAPVAVYVT